VLEKNKVKEKILSGKKVVGVFGGIGNASAVEILALAGMDYYLIDTEHGPFDVETASKLIIAAEARGITPMVRVKDFNRNSVLKMLDVGAMGIMVPFIKTVDEVKALVSYAKYSPIGERGCAFARKAGYGLEPLAQGEIQDYFDWANENTILMPQCETVEALSCIEEITAIEGVDAIFVGPFDLSVSMGMPKQFDDPVFIAALERILKACKNEDVFSFTLGTSPQHAQQMFDMGFDGVFGSDTGLLAAGTTQYLKAIRDLGF